MHKPIKGITKGEVAEMLEFQKTKIWSHPVAVPEKIFGLTQFLDFFDRGHSLGSLALPLAALPSLPPLVRLESPRTIRKVLGDSLPTFSSVRK